MVEKINILPFNDVEDPYELSAAWCLFNLILHFSLFFSFRIAFLSFFKAADQLLFELLAWLRWLSSTKDTKSA